MHFDTDGIYTLQYTATDSCGNETIEERTVEVVSYRTVLYTDGTFIINEKSSDQAANEALHGVATNVYDPFDPNGVAPAKTYNFAYGGARPWSGVASNVKRVEVGSRISPGYTRFWFQGMTTCTSMDLSLLNTSMVEAMGNMFYNCQSLTSLDLSGFDTSAVENMTYMFYNCQSLTSLDLSGFDTSAVTNMSNMFENCQSLTSLDLSGFDTSAVENMIAMFRNCQALTSLDLTDFNTSAVTSIGGMFDSCRALATIYASTYFVVTQVTSSTGVFANMSTNLVGGAGTVWSSSNPIDKTYAKIDGGTADPGYFTARA